MVGPPFSFDPNMSKFGVAHMTNGHPEAEWLIWNEVTRLVISLVGTEDFAEAREEVDRFLGADISPELRSVALGLRAEVREQLGDFGGAREDLLIAHSLVGPIYARYVHEISLGVVCEKLHKIDEAICWFEKALNTCLDGEGISAGTALKRLLNLLPEIDLSAERRQLCLRAARKSFEVLQLESRFDPSVLGRIVSVIKKGEANPPKRPTT